MDIGSKHGYPASALSNFAPHPFIIDGVKCNSMEGFLQSLKFDNPSVQEEVCKLVGFAAKKRGRHRNWQKTQTLWWKGNPYLRDGQAYQDLLTRAYEEMCIQSEGFQKALLATHNAHLTHSIGSKKRSQTVLTESEFCIRLVILRLRLQVKEGMKKNG